MLVLIAFSVTIVIGIVRGLAGGGTVAITPAPVASELVEAGVEDGGELYVHVSGAVAQPGLYRLPAGARAVDAVAAAGGFAEDAEQSAINLAREVADGEQLAIPVIGAAPPPEAAGATQSHTASGPVDLNTADAGLLDTLPRIGPALAERIVAWREQNGRFRSVDDLLDVPGIGEKIVDGLRDVVRV